MELNKEQEIALELWTRGYYDNRPARARKTLKQLKAKQKRREKGLRKP